MSVRDTVAAYIEKISHQRDFDHSSNLFENGLLTSLDVLSIVSFIEERFSLVITGDDMDMASFGTVDGLVSMITALQDRQK
jgi:methoxymalonate biosynthesis acyl carrier protein